jgi:hypothetical protein
MSASGLLVNPVLKAAHEVNEALPDDEHAASALMKAVIDVYFWESQILNSAEQPPTPQSRRRVDYTTRYAAQQPDGQCVLSKCLIAWECKKASASPFEVNECQNQVRDALERIVGHQGLAYGVSAIGSFFKIYCYRMPGKVFAPLYGGAAPELNTYLDISDPLEAQLVDRFFRELRGWMRQVKGSCSLNTV